MGIRLKKKQQEVAVEQAPVVEKEPVNTDTVEFEKADDDVSVETVKIEDDEEVLAGAVVNTAYGALVTMTNGCVDLTDKFCDTGPMQNAQDRSADIVDLFVAMSNDVTGFEGWSDASNAEQTVEVDYDGKKDTIVSSHTTEASFLDPNKRVVESVHEVVVAKPELPSPESKSTKKSKKASGSKRGLRLFKAKSTQASI